MTVNSRTPDGHTGTHTNTDTQKHTETTHRHNTQTHRDTETHTGAHRDIHAHRGTQTHRHAALTESGRAKYTYSNMQGEKLAALCTIFVCSTPYDREEGVWVRVCGGSEGERRRE